MPGPCRSRARTLHTPRSCPGILYRYTPEGDFLGMETDTINPELKLNLGYDEYLTAVSDQPKPLVIPLCAELPLPRGSPLDVFRKTRAGPGFLLESMEGSEKIARYSYVGLEPACVITVGREVTVTGSDAFVAIAQEPEGNNPVDKIRSVLARFHYINLKAPRFFGGMVGYFSYDIVHALFPKVPDSRAGTPQETPDARFMRRSQIACEEQDRVRTRRARRAEA